MDTEDLVHLLSPLEIFLRIIITVELWHVEFELAIEFFLISVVAAGRWSIIIIMRRIVSVRGWSSIASSCISIVIVGNTVFTWSTVATVMLSIAVVIPAISVILIMFRIWFTWIMSRLSLCSMVVAPVIIWMLLTVSFSPCFSPVSMLLFHIDDSPLTLCLLHIGLSSALFQEDDLVLAELGLGLLAAFDAHVLLQAWRLHESRLVLLHGEVDLEQHEMNLLVAVVVLEHPHYGCVGLEVDVLEDPHYGCVALGCAEEYG